MARAYGTGSTRDTYMSDMWRWLSLLLLLAFACASADAAAPPTTVRVGYITPFSGDWNGGVEMEAAVVLALEDVNAASSILPSTTLERVVKDSKCDPGLGMKSFIGKKLRREC